MGKLFDVSGTGVTVSVLTRDHCPPHVHCECVAEGWEARIAFSYLGDGIDLMDVVALKKSPRRVALNRVGAAVIAKLTMCRDAWWHIYADTCLENQWLDVTGRVPTPAPKKQRSRARQVKVAQYDPTVATTTIEFTDGSRRQIKLMAEAG